MEKLFFLEYSISQDAFNVLSVEEMIDKNKQAIARNQQTDYIPIAFADTRSALDSYIDCLRLNMEVGVTYRSFDGKTLVR